MKERIYDQIYVLCIRLLSQIDTNELPNLTKNWPQWEKDFILQSREIPLEERSDRAWEMYLNLDSITSLDKREDARWKTLILNLTDDVLNNIIESFK